MNRADPPRDPAGNPAWFPKKRIGYGWGLPITWQGWAVFLGYIGLSVLGTVFLARPPQRLPFFFLYFIP